ncbi:proteasome inhibitor 31 kDa isoform X2 [Andrena cerasifolii]|uniref:proteasome inhibitor 31 kDa isoform X2 n=1 Tax=Andrena cerasifolii TaxID=2819439 RepID=UPI004037AEED
MKAYDSSETASEFLPEGWNTCPNYALRYLNEGKLYILHGTRSDEDLLLNLLRVDNQSVSNTQYPINRTVHNLHGPLESLMPSYSNVLQTLQKDLLRPLLPNNTAETSTQTSTSEHSIATEPDADPLRVGPSARPRLVTQPWAPEIDPSRVGGADLNPFSRGGGMIFDPFNPSARNPLDPLRPGVGIPGRLPPGAVPPYARFDPFGPPDNNPPRPRRNPDSDDAMPPGYDDMFM